MLPIIREALGADHTAVVDQKAERCHAGLVLVGQLFIRVRGDRYFDVLLGGEAASGFVVAPAQEEHAQLLRSISGEGVQVGDEPPAWRAGWRTEDEHQRGASERGEAERLSIESADREVRRYRADVQAVVGDTPRRPQVDHAELPQEYENHSALEQHDGPERDVADEPDSAHELPPSWT